MVLVHGIEVRTLGGQQHVNLSTHTADGGLSKIQFRTAGSRMLRSVFYSQVAEWYTYSNVV
jgi:hypothetical protein